MFVTFVVCNTCDNQVPGCGTRDETEATATNFGWGVVSIGVHQCPDCLKKRPMGRFKPEIESK